jgi:very-short-patch-repair endonuclease
MGERFIFSCEKCGVPFKRVGNQLYCNKCRLDPVICKCGCGISFIKKEPYQQYIKGHGRKNRKNSNEHNAKISKANSGRVMTEETKKRLIASHIGIPCKQETKDKMSKIAKERGFGLWMTGKKLSKETVKKIIDRLTGKKCSESTKLKISKANSGVKNGMHGKTHGKEAVEKISIRSKQMWKEDSFREHMNELYKTEDMKSKLREGAILACKSIGKKKCQNTKPELFVKNILDEIGVKYDTQKPIRNILHKYACDFFLTEYNTILEVDGTYWHNYPDYRPLDISRSKEIIDAGYGLIRIWENQLDIAKDKIENYIKDIIKRQDNDVPNIN